MLKKLTRAPLSHRFCEFLDSVVHNRHFKVVDTYSKPRKPQWENCHSSAKCGYDKFIRNPKEVEPLRIEKEKIERTFKTPPLPKFVDVDKRNRNNSRNLGVVDEDNERLPYARKLKQRSSKCLRPNHCPEEPYKMHYLEQKQPQRNRNVQRVGSLIPAQKCLPHKHNRSIITMHYLFPTSDHFHEAICPPRPPPARL